MKRIFLVVLIGSLISCISDLDFEFRQDPNSIVTVSSKLVIGEDVSTFELVSQALISNSGGLRSGINFSELQLINDQGQSIIIGRVDNGIYQETLDNNDPDFLIDESSSFKIKFTQASGVVTESRFSSPAFGRVQNVSVDYDLISPDNILGINVSGDNLADGIGHRIYTDIYYKITEKNGMGETGESCFFRSTLSLDEIKLLNATNTTSERFDFVIHNKEVSSMFTAEGSYLFTIIENMDEESYNYWSQIDALQQGGELFAPAAGLLSSNFVTDSTNLLGFFSAVTHDSIGIFIPRTEFGHGATFTYCPATAGESGRLLSICMDCSREPGAMTEKPSFWPE